MTEKEFYRDLDISRHDESQSLLITSRKNKAAEYYRQLEILEIPTIYLPTITFVLKFKDNKWKYVNEIEPILWPDGSNTPTNEDVQIAIKEVEDYFNETYPTYAVYSLYEKMKEG